MKKIIIFFISAFKFNILVIFLNSSNLNYDQGILINAVLQAGQGSFPFID